MRDSIELEHGELVDLLEWLRAHLRRFVHDEAEVDDAVQNVALRALCTPPRHRGRLKGWCRTVALNELAMTARRERAWERVQHRALNVAHSPSAHALVERADTRQHMRIVVAEMPPPYREVITLRWLVGMSAADVARFLDRPPITVRSQLVRGYRLLRQRLRGR